MAEGTPWLTVTAGASGVGSGASVYSVAPNTGGPLSALMDIAGQKATITQDASPNCAMVPIGDGGQLPNTNLSAADCRSGQPERANAAADLYFFSGVAGQRVRIEMNAPIPPNAPGTGLDTFLYLFGPDGTVVAENDDIDLGRATNSRIPVTADTFFTLPQTGTYIIEATSFDAIANDEGPYTLLLTFSTLPSNQTSIAGGGSLTVAEGVGADGIGTEGVGFRTVSVTRSVTGAAASVDYATSDGTASSTSDYTAALGTLSFAPGEATKSFTVFVTDDVFLEPDETVNITLSNPVPVGTTLPAAATAVLTITSNDAASGPSPVREQSFNTRFFVRQHYLDFLGREPDAGGMIFWSNGLESCGTNAQCLLNKRIDTSAAFFLSIEFQETGFLVQRIYKTAYGEAQGQATIGGVLTPIPVPVVRFNEFLPDTQRIGLNVIVGSPGWPERLEANKVAFTQEFVARSRFTAAFPLNMTPDQFVDKLITNAGIVIESGDRNTAFVLMQYFGYLRRNPNDAPDTNHSGYNFWLKKLNDNGGDFRSAQMVLAFLDSIEYKQRFGQP
ncbi:MAG: pre-peptidase C-terminal domain-containing protein [Acidobacteria bacterium]|nr:pre-peptidase C-terminal domain-containing protein [Acidobacteriota bacterium]